MTKPKSWVIAAPNEAQGREGPQEGGDVAGLLRAGESFTSRTVVSIVCMSFSTAGGDPISRCGEVFCVEVAEGLVSELQGGLHACEADVFIIIICI